MTKILVLGNSHSGDTFWLLPEVFQKQLPDEKFVFGYLYYSGCPITKHVQFAYNEEPVYRYSVNPDGFWTSYDDVTMRTSLLDQKWDYIVLQPGRSDLDDTMALNMRRQLESYVDQYVEKPYQFLWQTTWSNPTDQVFWTPGWPVQAPANYYENLEKFYGKGFTNVDQFTKSMELTSASILPDDTYAKKLCIGAAVMYTILVMDRPQTEIYRDYTHLTDFGRLIASYAFFTQFTGQKVTEVKVDTVPTRLRINRYQQEGDLTVTDEMKQIISEAANYALDNPWVVPTK